MGSPGITSAPKRNVRRPFGAEGRAKAAALRARVEELGIVKAWLARAIGKSVNQTMQVLHGNAPSWVTLGLIEDVLAAVEAGQIRPETHAVPVAPILAEG